LGQTRPAEHVGGLPGTWPVHPGKRTRSRPAEWSRSRAKTGNDPSLVMLRLQVIEIAAVVFAVSTTAANRRCDPFPWCPDWDTLP
jgi:hypothetical protein